MTKGAVLYCRTSTEHQAAEEKVSIPEQLNALEALCVERGYQIVDRYVDNKRYRVKGRLVEPSGTRKDRPEYQRLLKDAREGKFDVILAWKEDRLYRGVFAVIPFGEMLEEMGHTIEVEFAQGVFDRSMLYLKAAMGKIEVDNLRDRITMGKRGKAKRGKWPGGRVPYGYGLKDSELVINEEQAKIVRLIFNEYVKGKSPREIAAQLNARGIPTPENSRRGWARYTVYRFLRRRIYIGECPFDDIVIPCPPIISTETWELAQAIKEKNKIHSPRNTRAIYLLQGLLYCEECGWRMVVCTGYRKNAKGERVVTSRRYRCNTSQEFPGSFPNCDKLRYLNADRLERVVWQAIDAKLREPELVRRGVGTKLAELEEALNEAKARASVLERRLTGLGKERQAVIRWARAGRITERDMALQLSEIEEKARAIQEDLQRAREIQALNSEEFNAQDLALRFYERIHDRLDYLSSDPLTEDKLRDRRELAKILLHKVWINKDREIRIDGHIPKVREEASFEFASLK